MCGKPDISFEITCDVVNTYKPEYIRKEGSELIGPEMIDIDTLAGSYKHSIRIMNIKFID